MDYKNLPLGLRVQTQIPLDVKSYSLSESNLKNLGPNNNLAFTYVDGMIVYCVAEKTRYEWKEVEDGDIGLLDNNFIYPVNINTFGIDYSNKEYNFVKIESSTPSINQNNYVRQLIIDIFSLPSTDYLLEDLIDYILALPEAERTITETDSKWNIIVAYPAEGGYIISEIYELQNKGKGVITELENENLLLITRREPSWNDTLRINPNLIDGINTQVNQSWAVFSNQGAGTSNGFYLVDLSFTDIDIPIFTLGAGMGSGITERSLAFYTDRTIFMDGLNEKGLEYDDDYSDNFTTNSLVTKLYTDTAIDNAIDSLSTSNQKIITYPTDFTGTNYTLLSTDHNKLIIVKNGTTDVTITVSTGLVTEHFNALLRQGTGEVSIVASGTIINSYDGLRIKNRYQQVALDKEGSTTTFYLTGNTKI